MRDPVSNEYSLYHKEVIIQIIRILFLAAAAATIGFMSPILVAKLFGVLPGSADLQPRTEEARQVQQPKPHVVGTSKRLFLGKGKEMFVLNCAPCHQITGEGNPTFHAPALAGQKNWYLVRQLRNFKNGTRGAHPEDLQGMQMAPMLRMLAGEKDIEIVAKYISRMTPFNTKATLNGDASKGKALFVGTCLPCHGERGQGNRILNAPMLAGQADWYLLRQLTKFKKGIRGGQADDAQGMQMVAMAKSLVGEQSMQDLAAYINRLRREAPLDVERVVAKKTAADLAKGRALYRLNCSPCHTITGEGNVVFSAPALAGQHDWYLTRQLQKFRDGRRGAHPQDVQGMQMAPMLRNLADNQAIKDVVAHIASMAPFDNSATLDGDAGKGRALFSGTCMPCHGEKGLGNPLTKAPMLAGQADWYLVRQLTKFKKGIRGAHKKDSEGMQMAAMAKTLLDEQATKDLAAYINGLR